MGEGIISGLGERRVAGSGTRRRRPRGWAFTALLVGGCLLDPDDLCSSNEVIWGDDERCVCVEGAAYTATGCVLCGPNEVASAAGCVCADRFVRTTPDAACTEQDPGDPGSPCSANAACVNPSYPHCELRPSGSGYCTNQGCTADASCAEGFRCITSASPPVCRLPPEGAGRPCASAADCAGSEALLCDTFMSQTCLVQDCNLDPNDCFPGTECCNVAPGVPNVCIPAGACSP